MYSLSSYSHRIGVWPLVEKLAERGHSVTFVSPFEPKTPNPNITEFVPKALKAWTESLSLKENGNFYDLRVKGTQDYDWFDLCDHGLDMCTSLLSDSDFVDWIKGSNFDLVIVDALNNECAYGMAYMSKAKLIIFASAVPYSWHSELFGYPDESSWIPDQVFHYPIDMNFYQRFMSALVPLYSNYLREVLYFPKLEKLFREKLEIKDMPSIGEIEQNISLALINQHYGEDFARSFPPNVIPVGGMHITKNIGTLPKVKKMFK